MSEELMSLEEIAEIEWTANFRSVPFPINRLLATARAAHKLREEVESLKRCIEMQADTFKTWLEAHKENAKLKQESETLRKDANIIRGMVAITHVGYAPQLLYDDDGHWKVECDSFDDSSWSDSPQDAWEAFIAYCRNEKYESALKAIDDAMKNGSGNE